MKVGLHQGSVLSLLLFVIVMEMISRELRAGLPLELLYADDLILMAESEESLHDKIVKCKSGLEAKGLKMNTGKTKVMKVRNADLLAVSVHGYTLDIHLLQRVYT